MRLFSLFALSLLVSFPGYAAGEAVFADDACTGSAISTARIFKLIPPGVDSVMLRDGDSPTYENTAYYRTRHCLGESCGDWSAPSAKYWFARVFLKVDSSTASLTLWARCGGGILSSTCSGVGIGHVTCAPFGHDAVCPELAGVEYQWEGQMTDHCLLLRGETGAPTTKQMGLLLHF